MAQIVEFPSPTGLASGANAYLFAIGSDTIVATASGVTEGTNATGSYDATFNAVTIGTYRIIAKTSGGTPFYSGIVYVSASSGTFAAGDYSLAPTTAQVATAVLTTQMTESYAADGTAPTLTQAVMLTQQAVTEFSISGTTKTIKKLDGSTTAATETLDSATAPTSITRAT